MSCRLLVDSSKDDMPCGIYMGSLEVRDAYVKACHMFAEIKQRLDSGQEIAPMISLAYIHAKLSGEDPVKLIRDEELARLVGSASATIPKENSRSVVPEAEEEALSVRLTPLVVDVLQTLAESRKRLTRECLLKAMEEADRLKRERSWGSFQACESQMD